VSESWLTDEEIAEWTSTHDVMREAQVGRFVVVGSYIPVAEVTVYLRTQRDRAQAHMDTLLLAQAASAHDKHAEAWPQGDVAAEQLARAMYDVVEDRDEPTYRDEIFLVVQQWPLNYRRRLAAAVLARLHAGAQGVGDGD
jgi:hypothetical protein